MAVIYTMNDEPQNPQVFVVDVPTGKTVGTFGLNPDLPSNHGDPEAICLDWISGILYLADTGDNDGDRPTYPSPGYTSLFALPEPGPGNHGVLTCHRYPVGFPGNEKINCETLAISPVSGNKFLATKESGHSRLYKLPTSLSTSAINRGTFVANLPANVSDAAFTLNGKWLVVRCAGVRDAYVIDQHTWVVEPQQIVCPATAKGESITMEPGGKSFLIGSEGSNSPIYRVLLPTKYRGVAAPAPAPTPTPTPGDCNADLTDPGDVLDLRNWKLTLDVNTGHSGNPDEIFWPELDTFENSHFYDICPPAVVMRAYADGATTGGSSNPRVEFREMKAGSGGQTEASWNSGNGTNRLDVVQAITHLPTRDDGHAAVVAGQIHNASDDVTVLRCESRNTFVQRDGKNILLCNLWMTKDEDTHYDLITDKYELGAYFHLRIQAASGGIVFAYDDFLGGGLKILGSMKGTFSGCYFKAGCYCQANPSNGGKGYGEVRIKSLLASHF